MKLVYFWVDEYKSIKQQGINFGSKYIYSSIFDEELNTLTIDRVENKKYVPNFYHTEIELSKCILEVTALVGQNGAGKSTMLEALRNALTEDRAWFRCVILYEYDGMLISRYVTSFGGEGASMDVIVNANGVKHVWYEKMKNIPSFQVLNYRTSFDNNFYPITHDKNKWIDVSTDWLLYEEKHKFEYVKPELDQVNVFRSEELVRQLNLSENKQLRLLLQERINIPNKITLNSWGNSMPSDTNNRTTVWNIPISLLSTYSILFDKIDEEGKVQLSREYSESLEERKSGIKGKVYAFFLEHILKNTFYHLNQSNRHLEKSFNESKIDFNQFDYEQCVKEFYKEFANSGFIDKYEPVVELIDFIKELIDAHEVIFIHAYIISIKDLSVEDTRRLLKSQKNYLDTIGYINIGIIPESFLSFEWRGLSSGEYALFNLFARIYHGAQSITNPSLMDSRDVNLPETIYLLLDEPDSSFHLQWEKEMIKLLVENIAAVFVCKRGRKKYIPKIQIVYTTHSPVSLSDIPNYNVNYFRKEGNGRLVVLDEKLRPQNSFGANIHVLIRDSFFLQNGLVGDFVAKKINQVIRLLNNEANLNNEEISVIQSILDIIDEPLLKVKMEEMFNEKLQKQGNHDIAISRLEVLKKDIERKINKIKKGKL